MTRSLHAPAAPDTLTAPVADLLRSAAYILDTTGWTRQSWQDDNGRVCLRGALVCAATGWDADTDPVYFAAATRALIAEAESILLNALDQSGGLPGGAGDKPRDPGWLQAYNDWPDRTAEQVIDLLRSTADRFGATA